MDLNTAYCIGLMSGTSLDGVDLIYVRFSHSNKHTFEILKTKTISYSEQWRKQLSDGFFFSGEELTALNVDYGTFLGDTLKTFINDQKIEKVDFIASHGHTIFHNPQASYTLQIGNGPQISTITGIKTVCDFRVQDVALGGQGAPLVPIGDKLLFSEYDYCLNIGGFANISFEKSGRRIAYDICPTNIVLNHYMRTIGREYDHQGQLARSGKVHKELLSELNKLDFYKESPPKSLGFEFVTQNIFPLIDSYNLPLEQLLRTFVEHIAIQLSNELKGDSSESCLVTGGGVFNEFLIERTQELTNTTLVIPTPDIINYKEALIFGLLGFLKLRNEVNCLSDVTGAVKDHSSGIIFDPI